ncbi:hypothetical protein TWF281_008665 [Arthrobotrys megalospora]
MSETSSSPTSPKRRHIFKRAFTFFKPSRYRTAANQQNESSGNDLPDNQPVALTIEPTPLGANEYKPPPSVPSSLMVPISGDMTIDMDPPTMQNSTPESPKVQAPSPWATLGAKVPVMKSPVILPPTSGIPSKPASLMRIAGVDRDSDLISPPFNLWEDIIKSIVDLGVTTDIVNPKALSNYIDLPDREAPWYEETVVTMFKQENVPYRLAIAYITEASKHVIKPLSSSKKKSAWMELGSFDFRLNAVDKNAENLIRDVTACKNKCGDTPAERKMALNAADLVEVLWELRRSVADLRETIMYRIIRKHDPTKANICIFSADL